MTNKIEEFLNEEFGTVRALKEGNAIWFVAKDLAEILKYKLTTDMTRDLEEYEKGMRPVHTLGGNQNLTVITEGGLYSIILSITKRNKERYEIAREFKYWITNEVLPTLRETGAYIESNREQEVVDKYFSGLSEGLKLEVFKELQSNNEKLQVKADKFDQFLDINSTYTFTEVAKMISTKATDNNYSFSISGQALTKHLRSKGILSKAKSGGDYTNAPIKKYENYFDVISRTIDESRSKPQTRVKPNGVDFLYDMFVEDGFSLFIK